MVAARQHEPTDVSPVQAGGIGHDDQASPVDHPDPVGEAQDLVQLRGDQQNPDPAIPLLDQLTVDELDTADVDTPGGLCGDQQGCSMGELAGGDDLLLVAT